MKATDWLDVQLGRVTMYRLMVYVLLTIDVVAGMLMVNGYLPYLPISFLVSICLFVGIAYSSNRLLGWLFGVRPHSESAIITGLILALLFSPPTSLLAGMQLGLVAVFAMASKYIIVIRNRHIFNPAAIAVVISSVLGLAFATWWVGSPGLLPVTVIGAGLILFKTKRLQVGLAFLLVAVTMIMLQTVLAGDVSVKALTSGIVSWPLVFLAGVMLSEPLTLPPRRWQQLSLAIVVGVLISLPIHAFGITMTPAWALVVGNAIAFYWSIGQTIKLRFVDKKPMGVSTYEFTFDAPKLNYLPGQYVELTLPHTHADSRGMRRMFSLVGRPGDEQLSIATRMPEKPSTFKQALQRLKAGQVVYGTRIAGDFVLPDDTSIPIVCVAGGIGITPYISFLMSAAKDRRVTLVYAVSSVADIAYARELQHYDVDVVIVSPDTAWLPSRDWRHIKEPRITEEILRDSVSGKQDVYMYISGPPGMVNATRSLAHRIGIKHVKTDHFAGY